MKSFLNILIFFAVFLHTLAVHSAEDAFFVNPGLVLVENWEGWGTSLAWWADVLGGMNEDVSNEISEAFFHPDKLNLNIVRYVIGGTTPPEVEPYPCGPYRDGGASETFQDGPGLPFNWTRDSRQRKILENAKRLGANIFEAFSNSPPQWMTISGCSKGNPGGLLLHANFNADQADTFAEYATEVIQHFHYNWNISFQYYEPFNEPMGLAGIGSWWGEASSQEGCNMNRQVMTATIKSLYETLERKNMSYVTITAADETEVNTAVGTAEYFVTEKVHHMISKNNVHGYWDSPGNRRDMLNILSRKSGQKLWMDEMGWGESQLPDMTQGFEIANRILADVHGMLPSAWVYWQVLEQVGSWGILGIPYRDNATVDDIQYNSGYFAMYQFSHYIKQGYRIIHVSDKSSLAAYDEVTKTLVIVKVHQSNSTSEQTFDLSLFFTDSSASDISVTATRTSPTEANAPVPPSEIKLDTNVTSPHIAVKLPAESITTIVVSNICLPTVLSSNLLKNGDFESTTDTDSWYIFSNGNLTDDFFPWTGSYSARLDRVNQSQPVNFLGQVIIVPTRDEGDDKSLILPVKLYLSLWASTVGFNSKIQVYLGLNQVEELSINPMVGYRLYSLDFLANPGDQVIIVIANLDDSGPVYVDDVQLLCPGIAELPTTTVQPSSSTDSSTSSDTEGTTAETEKTESTTTETENTESTTTETESTDNTTTETENTESTTTETGSTKSTTEESTSTQGTSMGVNKYAKEPWIIIIAAAILTFMAA